jgi:hypothetical protein
MATDGLVDAGFVVLGGPLDDEQRPVLVVEAESDDAPLSRLTPRCSRPKRSMALRA